MNSFDMYKKLTKVFNKHGLCYSAVASYSVNAAMHHDTELAALRDVARFLVEIDRVATNRAVQGYLDGKEVSVHELMGD